MRGTVLILSLISLGAVPSQQVTWSSVAPATQAQGYAYKLYIFEESGKKSIVTLVNTLCGVNNGTTQCSAALPTSANPAIVNGNQSQLTATDTGTNLESSPSLSFTGNQGCIFRDNLYVLNATTTVTSNRGQVNSVLTEFKNAKFQLVSNVQKGNAFVITERCVGYIVQ